MSLNYFLVYTIDGVGQKGEEQRTVDREEGCSRC